MTDEQALEILTHNWTKLVNPDCTDEELGQALDIAIKALEGNSQGEEWLDNFINRYNKSKDFKITDIRDREKLLDDLIPKGRWLRTDDMFETLVCSECDYDTGDNDRHNFCPNCGADMRGKNNGN